MMLIDPILIVLTGLTLIPILQIDGTKIDIQIILALLKIAILLINFKFMQGMVCHQKFKKNAKRIYGTRMFIILVIALQDFVVIYRKYHMIDQTKPGSEEANSDQDKSDDIFQNFDREKKVKLGWLIFRPYYTAWILEVFLDP